MHQDYLRSTINNNLCSPTLGFDEKSKERGFVWRMKDQKTGFQPAGEVEQTTVQSHSLRNILPSPFKFLMHL